MKNEKAQVTILIEAVKKQDGVITDYKVGTETVIVHSDETVGKEELIDFIKKHEDRGTEVFIKTIDGTKVTVVDEADGSKYLRTVGDSSESNDLNDLPEFE